MDDLGNAPSNGAESTVAPETQAPVEAGKPSASPREAIDKAFAAFDESAPAEAKPDRTRDESGRFAKAAEEAIDAAKKAVEAKAPEAAPKPAPQRFTKPAQEAWAATPEPVRVEVERAIGELQAGIEKYKGAAEAFEPIRQFHEMAQKSGTTLDAALNSYVGIENLLRSDPVSGLRAIGENMGWSLDQMVAILSGQAPVPQPRGDSPEVAALKAELQQLREQVGGVTQTFQQQRETEVLRSVESFATQNPYFDEVADDIHQMLSTGFAKDLPDAYAKAIRLNPDISARIAAEKAKTTAPQTRKAGQFITGSPNPGSNPTTKATPGSPRQAIDSAFDRVFG